MFIHYFNLINLFAQTFNFLVLLRHISRISLSRLYNYHLKLQYFWGDSRHGIAETKHVVSSHRSRESEPSLCLLGEIEMVKENENYNWNYN